MTHRVKCASGKLQSMFYTSALEKCAHRRYLCRSVTSYHQILSEENKLRCKPALTPRNPHQLRKMPWMKDVSNVKCSAVLVPLCLDEDGEAAILFTHRSSSLRSHRGQVSFPGGMRDRSDTTFVSTALRETEEEIGLCPDRVHVWGQLDPVRGRKADIAVVPVVGDCGTLRLEECIINPEEVQDVFTVSLRHLCSASNIRYTTYTTGPGYSLPVFLGSKERIWGLTAVILHRTLQVIAPQHYKSNLPQGEATTST